MAATKTCLVFLCSLAACSGFFFGDDGPLWNKLKVKFPLSTDIPRTVGEAKATKGYLESVNHCGGNITHSLFRGRSFMNSNNYDAIPLYDANGYIAGIQTSISAYDRQKYPGNQQVFVKHDKRYYLTAYFVDPKTICTGRTQAQYEQQGTGYGLYIQTGKNPETDYMKIPNLQKDIGSKPVWKLGKCFPKMGVHYWYNITEDMNCEDFFPVFALYNDAKLTAFGWAMMSEEKGSLYEHPNYRLFGLFMKTVPKCTAKVKVSTQHIYLRDANFLC